MNSLIFWIALIVYSAIVIALGLFSWNKQRKETAGHQIVDFWLGGRQLSWWNLAVSLTSGWLMLGWLGYGISMIYQMGLSGAWTLFIPWFILCFIIIAIIPFVRRLPAISLPEAINKRFGPPTRTLLAFASIFVFTSWTGAELYMMGMLGAPFLKISPVSVMILIALVVMIYVGFGGFRADVWTDVFQFFIMAPFIVILAIVAIVAARNATGGQVIQRLAETATPYYGAGSVFRLFACGIAMPIILLFAYIPGWMIEQDLLLRIQGARSLKDGYKFSILSLVLISIFVLLFPMLIGFNALVLFPPGAEASAAAIGTDATGILSGIILKYFPIWAQVLMFIGILASQMSTVDTFSNVTALPIMYDFIHPVFMKKTEKKIVMRWNRIISVGAVILGLAYAVNSTSLMDVYVLSSGVLTASIAIPAFAIFWKKANKLGVVLSAILGFVGNVGFYILEYRVWHHNFQPKWFADTYLGYIIVGMILSIIGLIVGSLIGRPSSADEQASVSPKPLEGIEIFDVTKE
jgi:SSS family solute:Na+ symporter